MHKIHKATYFAIKTQHWPFKQNILASNIRFSQVLHNPNMTPSEDFFCFGFSSLPVHWSDDDVPPTADLPQDGRRPRPDHVLPAAALRGVSAGRRHRAHRRQRPDSASPERQGRHQTSGSGIPTVVQLHQQRLSFRRRRGGKGFTSGEPLG